MTNSTNPLFKHFRQPQLYIKLPSNGRWYKPGSIDMPVTKELPVYGMTAKDEILVQTPDALLSGQSTVEVIQSCIPNIKNAWEMPIVDLDYVLIAIRRATYGNGMEITTTCPHCKQKNESMLNLEALSNNVYNPNFQESIVINNLEIFIQPQNFRQLNLANIKKFENQRILNMVNSQDITEEEKVKQLTTMLNDLLELVIKTINQSIVAIKTEDGTIVQDSQFIDEFLRNCTKPVWESIKSKIEEIAEQSPLKKIKLTCTNQECIKDYTTPLIFELTNFFE